MKLSRKGANRTVFLSISFVLPLAAIVGHGSRTAQAAHSSTLVGPNVMVSKSSPQPRVEMQIAANPKNAKNLIATAIETDLDGDRCKAYATFDGGYTWLETTLTELPETGSGDPQVAFGPDGTAYFTAIGEVRGDDGKTHFAAELFRSEDGGRKWVKTATYGVGVAPDHEQIIVAASASSAGRIYISAGHRTTHEPENIGVFLSDDRGTTVSGPLHVASGAGQGLFAYNPVVFSNGTLFVPFIVSEQKPLEQRKMPGVEIAYETSSDGGKTFSAMAKIRTQILSMQTDVANPYAGVVFATDASEKFRDRLYMLWGEAVEGHYHLKLSWSQDEGKTWSDAHEVGEPPREANQFRPAICISKLGVVGVSWLDTRGTGSARIYNEYFAASIDGGESFLEPVKVSSQASPLDAPENRVLRPTIDSPRVQASGIEFSFVTTAGGFTDGGDYLWIAADADGVFHPIWADTRTGSYQAWTAAIKVGAPVEPRVAGDVTDVTQQFVPLFDAAKYDAETGIEEIPVRLKNASMGTVCGPIVAHVKRAEAGRISDDEAEVLNGNHESGGRGVAFDYSKATGAFSCLAPGEASEAVVWRLKPGKTARTFVTMQFTVTGVAEH